jgi:hypothetical protein
MTEHDRERRRAERRSAERFSQDLDRLLGGERPEAAGEPTEYREALETAARLARTPWPPAEEARARVRRVVLGRKAAHAAAPSRARRRGPLLVAVGLALALLLALPSSRAALVRAVERAGLLYRHLPLGAHLAVERLNPRPFSPPPPAPTKESGEPWAVETPWLHFTGRVPEGRPSEVRRYADLAAAVEDYPLEAWAPARLPEGYALREVILSPDDTLIARYAGGGEIVLAQCWVGQLQGRSGAARLTTTGDARRTNVAGSRAAWLPVAEGERGGVLAWEAPATEGSTIAYTLAGPLSMEEAVRLAEGLAPITGDGSSRGGER